jgi:hypothetical protein
VIANYASILRHLYTGEAIVVGLGQLRPVFRLVASTPSTVDALSLTAAVILFAAIWMVALAERPLNERLRLAAPPMVALWSLLTFYHLTYGFLILLPLAARLLLVETSGTQTYRRRLFWTLQLGMMFDVPGLSRRLLPLLSAPGWVDDLLSHFDRALVLGLYSATAVLALRAARMAAGRSAPARDAATEVVT